MDEIINLWKENWAFSVRHNYLYDTNIKIIIFRTCMPENDHYACGSIIRANNVHIFWKRKRKISP